MPASSRILSLLAALAIVLGLSTATVGFATSAQAATAPTSMAWGGYTNGYIPASALCAVPWDTAEILRCDAASKFTALNKEYKAKFGANICVNDAYRSYARQVELFKLYGSPRAAKPGTSNHGWAVAIDLGCGVGIFGHERYKWFEANAPRYNIAQPAWAKQTGSNPEAWHWQYFGAYLAPAAEKVATTTVMAFSGTWPRYATVTVRNKATGKAIAGGSVTIKRRTLTTTAYTTVGTVKTNSAGQYSYKYYPNTPTVITFAYAGSTSTLPSSAGATMSTPTTVSGRVESGRPNRLVGRLLTLGGKAVPAQSVILQKQNSTGTWSNVVTLRTNSTGYVTYKVQPKKHTHYRFRFPGKPVWYWGDYSPTMHVAY